jgi:hypothetical protein
MSYFFSGKRKGVTNHFGQTRLCQTFRLELLGSQWGKVFPSFINTLRMLLALFALGSCIAAPQSEFMGANGKMVYAISCQAMDDCAIRARELCPSGHDVVPAASGAGDTTARGGIGDTPTRKLLIECKEPSP